MNCTDPIASALLALNCCDEEAVLDDAIRTLTKLVEPVARRTASRFSDHHLEADDLVQAILARLLHFAEDYQYDPARDAAPLVTCVAYRAAISAARSLSRQRPRGTLSLDYEVFRGGSRTGHYTVAEILPDPGAQSPAEAVADGDDVRLAIATLTNELSRLERAVWIARHIHGRLYSEIAAALSVGRAKPYTVRSIDNAEQRARAKFERIQRVRRIHEAECRIG